MVCPKCGDHPKKKCPECGMSPKVVEIINPEGCPVLFHKISVPASLGDDTGDYAPENGKYKNILVEYEANGHVYMYSSDGIYTRIDASTTDFNALINRPRYAGQTMTSATDIPDVAAIKAKADTAVQPDDINYDVVTSVETDATPSTTVVNLKGGKVNLKTGTTTSYETALPVASTTQAGVVNSATYDAIQSNSQNINTILGGSVALTGISSSPTQSELTNAWLAATSSTELISGASILDVDNDAKWEYYSNDTTWHEVNTGGSISVSIATNDTAGIVKGSTTAGQVYAESNGTLSVNGWDTTQTAIANNTSAIAGKQATLVSGTNIKTVNGNSLLGSGNLTVTASIPDASVTSSKIDYSTMGGAFSSHTYHQDTVSTTTEVVIPNTTSTFTVSTSGAILVYASAVGRQSTSGNWHIMCEIDYDTPNEREFEVFTCSTNDYVGHSGFAVLHNVSAGQHTARFLLQAAGNGHNAYLSAYNTISVAVVPLAIG